MKQETSRLDRKTALEFDRTGFQDLWACVHAIPNVLDALTHTPFLGEHRGEKSGCGPTSFVQSVSQSTMPTADNLLKQQYLVCDSEVVQGTLGP